MIIICKSNELGGVKVSSEYLCYYQSECLVHEDYVGLLKKILFCAVFMYVMYHGLTK